MSYFEKILSYANDNGNFAPTALVEFELKLLIDPRNKSPPFVSYKSLQDATIRCQELFRYFETLANPINKQTISFINSTTHLIKELHFKNGIQDKEAKQIYYKKRQHSPIYICADKQSTNFKISLSEEEQSTELQTDYDLIRFKQRFRFPIKDWNIDFTFIKTSSSKIMDAISEIKQKLFVGTDLNSIFAKNAWIWEYADIIEIEFEYRMEDNNPLEISHIHDIIQVVQDSNAESLVVKSHGSATVLETLQDIVGGTSNNGSGKNTLKKILPNAIEINKKQYMEDILPKIDNFYLTDKADGVRTILIINDIVSYYNSEYIIMDIVNPFNIGETIVECELVGDVFYIFDILKYDGVIITDKSFTSRLPIMHMLEGIWEKLEVKNFEKLTSENYSSVIRKTVNNAQPYYVDGIIFTEATKPYRLTKFYKWKPVANMTIDFMAKPCPSNLLGISPYIHKEGMKLYILFSGINASYFNKFNMIKIKYYNNLFMTQNNNYFPVQFCPSDNPMAYLYWYPIDAEPIDSRIVELRYLTGTKSWDLVRIRADRDADVSKLNYFGNDFRVAELIWRNYSNPLTLDILCSKIEEFEKEFYFKVHNSDEHKAVRKFNNMVKLELISRLVTNFTHESWVIDLGCGKGQDLYKYQSLNVRNVLFIDNNENNLCSIIERKYAPEFQSRNPKNQKNFTHRTPSTGIHIKNLDLNEKWSSNSISIKKSHPLVRKIESKLVVCNFAIHYFCHDNDSLDNFINIVDELLPSGGRFMFTCLDGETIYNLLKTSDASIFESWGDKKKYLIKPLFTNKIFRGGEQIEILLPFSNNELYKESLVNLKLVETKFKRKKIMIESKTNFDKYLVKFKENDRNMYKTLDAIDMSYIKLLHCSVYYKK